MITINLHGTNIGIKLENQPYPMFTKCISYLKDNRFRWDDSLKEWLGSHTKLDSFLEKFEDIEEIVCNVDKSKLDELFINHAEQITEPIRRIPDYSLMKLPPIEGKHPNEDFQKKGINIGINRSRYYYAWGCGSGKSYVTAALIAHRLYKYEDCGKVLLITSNIGVRNLYSELFKFIKDLKEEDVVIADKNFRNPFTSEAKIIITSYNSFRLVCDFYKKEKKITSTKPKKPFLPLKEWSKGQELMLLLDEAHNIDTPTSQQSYLVRLHAPEFKYRYFFSATPFDKIEKQWCPLTALDCYLTYGLSYNQWLEKLAYLGNHFSQFAVRDWKKSEVEKQSQRFLEKHGNFYNTDDLVDLPEYNEKKIYLKMSPSHRSIYEQVVMQNIADKKTARDVMNIFPFLMLAVDCPELLQNHSDKFTPTLNTMLKNFKFEELEKVKALDDIISDHPREKILVWAAHPSTINLLAKRYEKLKPIVITGETPQSERNKLLDDFKNGDHQLLCGNISCLNTSVTLTECACQVYFSQTFNYTEIAQSKCRIYRIGQEKEVESYILLYNKSLDCLLDHNILSKGTLLEGLCKKEFLTQEQWRQIFNCDTEQLNF